MSHELDGDVLPVGEPGPAKDVGQDEEIGDPEGEARHAGNNDGRGERPRYGRNGRDGNSHDLPEGVGGAAAVQQEMKRVRRLEGAPGSYV